MVESMATYLTSCWLLLRLLGETMWEVPGRGLGELVLTYRILDTVMPLPK